ncbi:MULTISPECIES: carbohydrate kinase family protein [unclassified Prevotella]|jgi:putative fructokinase|uniref:carbohydrate kinase family protein n=1 Tax=unclassified Prevotella TaxID=2638335 RepID=UPI000BA1469E|nr:MULTISPECIES: carbohydrate kinase [unclassified Prevotella]MBD9246136.1 carbohydrate kinase [Prevotella sp.]OZT04875.1 carbohydrate kinase [Prevotella sp. 885]
MRKVIGIGETMLDIIFKNGKPIEAVPGGSTFNGIVSLGRAGVKTVFVSETGNDRVGEYVRDFLRDNNVDTSAINVFQETKSPVSLAFLDKDNNADYIFYRDQKHDHMDFAYPDIQKDDIVVFGSFYAVNPALRPQVSGLLEYARQRGAIIYYDVNFRKAHQADVMKVTPNLIDNLEYADIVRGSKEDFEVLYKKDSAERVYRAETSFYCKRFIYTDGPNPVSVFSNNGFHKEYAMPKTETVSTIGAGDNFNAGFIYGMIKYGVTRDDVEQGLSEEVWDKLIATATAFSADCCKDIFNYISKEFGQQLQNK